MPDPNDADGEPDFSFLGDQSVPDADDVPDFGDTEAGSEVPDFSDFGNQPIDDDPPPPPIPDLTEPEPPAAAVPPPPPKPTAKPTAKPAKPIRKLKRVSTPKTEDKVTSAAEKAGRPSVAADEGASSASVPAEDSATQPEPASRSRKPAADAAVVPQKTFTMIAAYAVVLSLLFLGLLVTGRINLSGRNTLESLPDIKPLPSNEFRKVPDDAPLPDGHVLNLGESRRFGDVVLTPFKVTREPLTAVHMRTGTEDKSMPKTPVLKLWFHMENASPDIEFPPWDVGLMSHRSEKDGTTLANSWLMVQQADQETEKQILNYFQNPDGEFDLVDQHSREPISPGKRLTSFIAASDDLTQIPQDKITAYRWRIQFRKGVHFNSGHGVTTLVDVNFSPEDIDA